MLPIYFYNFFYSIFSWILRLMICNEAHTLTLISFFAFGFNEILIAISQMEIMCYTIGVIWYPLTGLRAILKMRDCSYFY